MMPKIRRLMMRSRQSASAAAMYHFLTFHPPRHHFPTKFCPNLRLCSALKRFHRRPTCRSALLLRPSACHFLSKVLPPSQVLYRNPCCKEPAGASKRVKVLVCCNQSLLPQRLSHGGSAHTSPAAPKQQVHRIDEGEPAVSLYLRQRHNSPPAVH